MVDLSKIKLDYFGRDGEGGEYLETFLIFAVTSVLGIRFFLALTGYPQIGGGGIHIAHVLFGGILMMASILILLVFLNRESKYIGAVVGGIGFGAFIDELGKLITSDNNYFFQPTISLIYVVFILVYLLAKLVDSSPRITKKEYAANALQMLKEAALHDLDLKEKEEARSFLEKSDPRNPLVKVLKETIDRIDTIPQKEKGLLTKLRDCVRHLYLKAVKSKRLAVAVIGFFVFVSFINVFFAVSSLFKEKSFSGWGFFLSSLGSSFFVLAGSFLFLKKEKRLEAYKMFKAAVLVSIFLIQFFLFFKRQLSAVTNLAFSVLIWSVLENLIRQERLMSDGGSKI